MTGSPIERLIEASSLGTHDAQRLRATVTDDTARRIVERAKQVRREDAPCETWFCPTSGEVECGVHGGFDVCCDRYDLHQPSEVRCA
ncbi:hypothetical protein ACIODS_11775 [Micromonospora chalcea]|uniref:hypothetical protein n=1 Tax=Micromonospora chalcea TaxID=1874 RepID=UPI00381D5BB0